MKLDNLLFDKTTKKIYRDGNTVIKLFDENYDTNVVLSQALNQSRAHDFGIPAADILEVTKVDGKWAIVSEYFEGESMMDMFKKYPERQDELMEKFVKLQLSIFEHTSYRFPDQLDRLNDAIGKLDMDAVTRFALHQKLSLQKYNNVCHGDFVPGNVLVNEKGEVCVLNWTHANHGNPKYDIVTTYVQISANMQNQELAEKYLEEVIKQTGYEKESLEKLVPIISAVLNAKSRDEEVARRFLDLYLKTDL